MLKEKEKPWKSQKSDFTEALRYLRGRKAGTITSLKTPWLKFDDAGAAGIEWQSTVVVGGRSGTGKTLLKDQMVRESFALNPGENIRVLDFELEMVGTKSVIREFCSITGKSYTEMLTELTNEDIAICDNYVIERLKYPIDVVEKSPTVKDFEKIIRQYMDFHSFEEAVRKTHKDESSGVITETTEKLKKYKKTIISLDHTILLKRAPGESVQEMLYHLGETLTQLKREYPVIFIILSQLNRDIEKAERMENGKQGNYVSEGDFFGSDAMLQHADLLVGMNRPAKYNITQYGPNRYVIHNKNVMAIHFLKLRNGEPRLSFFEIQPTTMTFKEIPTPIMHTPKKI